MGSASVDPALIAIWAEVLGVDALDVDDDFFALGGNSLMATQITARVADVLGVDVALDALFEAPTLGAYAEQVRAAAPAPPAASARNGRTGGRRWLRGGRRRDERGGRGTDAGAPEGALSSLQASAWSVQRYLPDVGPYVGEVFSLQGPLDVDALDQALTALVRRHEILRTIFPVEDHRPRARVLAPEPVHVELVTLPRRAREADVRRHVDASWSEPFDYATRPPLRLRLIRSGPQSHVLVFILHEILCDGQAYDLLVRELGQLYAAALAAEPSPLAEPALQYREVLQAHGTSPTGAGGSAEASSEHWRATLADAPLALPLPFPTGEAPAAGGGAYARRGIELPAQLVARLRALTQQEASTSFMLYLAALYALLHRWTGETDLLVKSPTANRTRVEWEQVVGFFSMVLPLRVDVSDDPSFRALLRRTRDTSLAAFRHAASTPEDNELRAIDGLRGLGGWAVLFRLLDPTTEQPLELAGVRAKPYREEGEAGRLVLAVTERADGRTSVQVSSTTDELDARALGELLRHYERLLAAAVEDPDLRVGSELELLTPAERERLAGRAAGGEGGGEGGLHGLVAAAAQRTPDAVAFDGGDDEALAYAALDARAEQLASLLRERGIAAEAPVGVAIPPSGALLVAMLGVLKAGAACVPLLDSDGAELAGLPPLEALVTSGGGGSAPGGVTPRVVVDLEGDAEALAAADAVRGSGDGAVTPERIALVLRTAGVTGAPRAVPLTHRALCQGAARQRDLQRLTAGDRVAHVPGRGVWSWALAPWAALAAGATVVGPARAPDPRSTTPPSGWLEANRITVAAMGTGLAGAALSRPDALPSTLRLLLVQGAGPLALPETAAGRRRGALVVQRQYGLLEGGGVVLSEQVGGSGVSVEGTPLVGEPLGARATVLDRHGNVAPAGVAGELQLDGPHLTAPVHTGDLARSRADGKLELLGRIADEVRYRGVRLNPVMRDIEAALIAHPGLQAAVTCWEPASAALVACVVPRRAEAPAAGELDAWLQRTMADWILPVRYVAVDAIPLRPDGLPDRRALAGSAAVVQALAERAVVVAPQTRAERALAEAWKQVLGQRGVGVHDNFFAAGGTLALGLELLSRARATGVEVEPGRLLFQPTIAELAG